MPTFNSLTERTDAAALSTEDVASTIIAGLPAQSAALRTFRRHFRVEQQRGIGATVKLAYPFLAIPGLASIGRRLARPLIEFDDRHTRRRSLTLYQAWHITMKLRPLEVARPALP